MVRLRSKSGRPTEPRGSVVGRQSPYERTLQPASVGSKIRSGAQALLFLCIEALHIHSCRFHSFPVRIARGREFFVVIRRTIWYNVLDYYSQNYMNGEDVIYGDKPSQQAQLVFGQDRLCAGRGGRFRGTGQHLALSLSGGEVRRRHLSAGLHSAGLHLRLHDDRGGDRAGAHDPQEPGGRLPRLRQGKGPVLRRMDQRHHPHSDRPLLLRHRRLGD